MLLSDNAQEFKSAEVQKILEGYTLDFKNKGKIGSVLFSTSYWADPTFFSFRTIGGERVTSLSVGRCVSGKEKISTRNTIASTI